MNSKNKQYGLSLIELMIAMAAGLLLIGGVISIYTNSARTNSDSMKIARLNQELRAAMTLMTNDIRRAGYWGTANNNQRNQPNPFKAIDTATANCILFSYDRNSNGTLDTDTAIDERMGYRLQDGVIKARTNGAACAGTGWQSLTDDSITITTLQFTLTESNVTLSSNHTGTPGLNQQASEFFSRLAGFFISDANALPVAVPTLTIRTVTITLVGRLSNDASVSRSLTTSVRVQNDAI